MRYRVRFYQHAPSNSVKEVEADDVMFYNSFVSFSVYPEDGSQVIRVAAFNNSDVESVELVDED